MYSRNTFGSYYPIDSSIHRLNPVVKLVNFLICIMLICFTNNLIINVSILAMVIIMMFLSFVPLRFYSKTIWSLRYIYILILFICAFLKVDIQTTIVYIIKLISVVEYLNVLAFTTCASETIYSIEKFLTPFNIFYLELTPFALKVNNILRYIPFMLNTEYKTLKSSASRGLDYYHSNILTRIYVVFTLSKNIFYLTNIRNKDISSVCEQRLYNNKRFRTNYRTNKVGFYDVMILLFHMLLIFAYIFKERLT